MKWWVMLILVFGVGTNKSIAQDSLDSDVKVLNAIYFELLGSGIIYSLNYERIFKNHFTIRGGFSYLNSEGGVLSFPRYIFPVSSSYLLSTDEDSHLEFGLGVTFHRGNNMNGLFPVPIIGFREQDLINGGGTFRISFTPFILADPKIKLYPFGGLSFGTSF